MRKAKKRLELSLIGLFTIPYFFIILCGLLCIKYTILYFYIDWIIFIFILLLLVLMAVSAYHYRKYDQMQKHSVNDVDENYHQFTNAEQDTPQMKEEEGAVFVKHIANSEYMLIQNLIGKGSTFMGDLDTQEDILIEGIFKGDLVTSRDVFLDGTLEGNVTCQYLAMKESRIIGNVNCRKELILDESCIIKGNVVADEIILNGKIEGDLCVRKHLILTSTSIIVGDIDCTNIDFAHGAIIKGKVSVQ